MRVMRRVLILWLLAPVAWGSSTTDEAAPPAEPSQPGPGAPVDEARTAIQDGDFELAHDLLDKAEKMVPKSEVPVLPSVLSRIQYYRGILEYYVGDREVQALEYFKAALVHDQEFKWDTELVAEEEAQDLFEMLRSEINSRSRSSAGVPVAAITEKIYVDGSLMTSYDDVVEGRHLVQVLCAKGGIESKWVLFGEAPDYGCFCSMAECFRPPLSDELGGEGGLPLDLVLMGSGGAALAAGTVLNFLYLEPRYAEVVTARENPSSVNREEADLLTENFQKARVPTLAALGVGTVLAGAGGALWWVQTDLDVSIGPGGVHFLGRF